jgi:hypothetical protein
MDGDGHPTGLFVRLWKVDVKKCYIHGTKRYDCEIAG